MSKDQREKAPLPLIERIGLEQLREFHAQVIRNLPLPEQNAMQGWISEPGALGRFLKHLNVQPFCKHTREIFYQAWSSVYRECFQKNCPAFSKMKMPFWPSTSKEVSGIFVAKGFNYHTDFATAICKFFRPSCGEDIHMYAHMWNGLTDNRVARKNYFILCWPRNIYCPSSDRRVDGDNPNIPEDGLTLLEGLLYILHSKVQGFKFPEDPVRIVCAGSVSSSGQFPVIDISKNFLEVSMQRWDLVGFRNIRGSRIVSEIINFEVSA